MRAIYPLGVAAAAVLLVGCSALVPWLAGKDADLAAIRVEIDGYKKILDSTQAAAEKADANADGKLSLWEAIMYMLGFSVVGGSGTAAAVNVTRNRARKIRGERVSLAPPKP